MKKIQIETRGLEGETLAFANKINEAFSQLPEGASKEDVTLELRNAGLIGEDGKAVFDFKQLGTLLGEGEGSLRSILIEQGEMIASLKNSGKTKKMEFRTLFDKFLDKASAVAKRGTGSVELSFAPHALEALEVRSADVHATDNGTIDSTDLPEDLVHSFSIGNFVEKRRPYEFIFDFANRTTSANIVKYKIWQEEGNEEGAFALVDEDGLKPLVQGKLVDKKSQAKKIAGKIIVTDEFEKWRSQSLNEIKRLVRSKLVRDYAIAVTNDMLSVAPGYVGSALDGTIPANLLTYYHCFAAGAAQLEALDFNPDTLFLNPQDKWRIGMSQNEEGSFYLNVPAGTVGLPSIMGFNVITSNRVPVGTFGIAESGLWQLEEETIKIKAGYGITVTKTEGNVTDVEHDLDHNRFRTILEMYFHSYIASNNLGSFMFEEFDVVRTALEEPEGNGGE